MIMGNGTAPVSLAHYIPGRIRVKLTPESSNPEFVDQISNFLKSVPGIQQIESRLVTRSVIIRYDPEILDIENLLEIGRASNLIALDGGVEVVAQAKNSPASPAPSSQVNWMSMVPLVLVLISAKQILVNRRRPPAPWYALLWYAYSIYLHNKASSSKPVGSRELDLDAQALEMSMVAAESAD